MRLLVALLEISFDWPAQHSQLTNPFTTINQLQKNVLAAK